MEIWKKNIQPLYDKEMEDFETVEKKTFKSVWYVQVRMN